MCFMVNINACDKAADNYVVKEMLPTAGLHKWTAIGPGEFPV